VNARDIYGHRIDPFGDEFLKRMKLGSEASLTFEAECGRDEAILEARALDDQADDLFGRLLATPAQSLAGKAAKVRSMFALVLDDDGWRGPADNLDWDKGQIRALLGDLAGISEAELAAL
jgi:hypothetical protein